ncbi:MAG: hypothetical protein ABUL48_02575 [Pseudorhodoplanes sp.]
MIEYPTQQPPRSELDLYKGPERSGFAAFGVAAIAALVLFAGFLFFYPPGQPVTTTYNPASSPAETTGAAPQTTPSAASPQTPSTLPPQTGSGQAR